MTTGYCIVSFDRNEDTCAIGPIRVQDVAWPFWGAGGVVVVIVGQTLAILRKPVGRLLIEDD